MSYKVRFYRTDTGNEPVREWLQGLAKSHRYEVGRSLLYLQKNAPDVGMPLSKSLSNGLYELRIPYDRVAYRLFYGYVENKLILVLHGIVKKSQKTPKKELELARKRFAEVKRRLKNG